jgi:type IV pilus assembly protein PilE
MRCLRDPALDNPAMEKSPTSPAGIATRNIARARGFTLIELMITVAIVALLGAIALPAYFDTIRKTRRSDAITAIAQAQQAQERYRANQTTYGTHFIVSSGNLTGMGVSADTNAATTYTTSSGYYALTAPDTPTGTTYSVLATAQGTQASDTNCKYMKMSVSPTYSGNTLYESGSTSSLGNGTSANKLCWKQ